MKKVLFFIPTLTGGGAEKVLVNLVNHMDHTKYHITVLSLFDVGVNRKSLNSVIEYKYAFKRLFRGNIHVLKLFSPRFLFKHMIKDDYDVIVSYLQGPTTRIASGCNNPNTKLLNWLHLEIHETKKITRSYRSLPEAVSSYNKYNATVCVSNTVKEAFLNTFKDIKGDFFVKYNTVETKLIEERSNEVVEDLVLDREKINLVSVGRFAEQKGYERLLNITSKLICEGFNLHLYLLGTGELEKSYRDIIKKNNIEDHVTLLGYKDNPYKYVKSCDLFVCSSLWEGFSTAVTESLIVGTPVITTLCSGMEEMLGQNNDYGIIVDNDENALYAGLKDLLQDKERLQHYRMKARERGKYFSTEKTVKEVEDLIDGLCK